MLKKTVLLLSALCCTVAAGAASFSDEDLRIARDLRDSAMAGTDAYVADLTTNIGPRLAGSPADAKAVEWAIEMFESMDFDRVYTEPATFPTWKRGTEIARVVAPAEQELVITALGFSPSTPDGGITAGIVMLEDFEALQAADPADLEGRIVFIRNRMERAKDGSGYGRAVVARSRGPLVAADKGAKALLIRSIGTSDNRFAHTGNMRFDLNTRRIPAAALSNPDADLLARLARDNDTVRVHLELGAQVTESYTSQNVIGEITGGKWPEKVVAIGAHLDSWDLGTGAIDDGSGVAIVTETAERIMALDERPDRSIRVILFAAEEIGLWGGRAWKQAHQHELENYQVATESDFGAGRVYAFSARVQDSARPVIEAIHAELEPLGIELTGRRDISGGPDFSPMARVGLSVARLHQDGTDYFDYHHTVNDTLDKVDADDLDQNVAAFLVFTWLSAQSPVDFGSGPELVQAQ